MQEVAPYLLSQVYSQHLLLQIYFMLSCDLCNLEGVFNMHKSNISGEFPPTQLKLGERGVGCSFS